MAGEDEGWPPPGAEELRVEDILLDMLEDAKRDLERRNLDAFYRLRDRALWHWKRRPESVPDEVKQFLSSFKRERGRYESRLEAIAAFRRDPNRWAAWYAGQCVRILKEAFPGKYNVTMAEALAAVPREWIWAAEVEPDDVRRTLHATAAILAVSHVNGWGRKRNLKNWTVNENYIGGENRSRKGRLGHGYGRIKRPDFDDGDDSGRLF